jgi:tight adherence protein B
MSAVFAGVLFSTSLLALAIGVRGLRWNFTRNRARRRLGSRPEVMTGTGDARRWRGKGVGRTPLMVWAPVLVCAVGGLVVDGAALALLLSFLAAVVIAGVRSHRQGARLRAYNRNLVRVLDVIVLSLRSGAGLAGGIREAAGARDGVVERDLREVVRQMDFGLPFEESLQAWSDRSALRSVRLTVACMLLAHETGGSNAASIAAVRATVRNAMTAESSVQTHAAQARASVAALSIMPLALSGPMLATNAAARQFMLHTPIGVSLLMAGLVLDVLGLFWMSRLIAGAQS